MKDTSVSPHQVDLPEQKAATSEPQQPAPPSDADLCFPPKKNTRIRSKIETDFKSSEIEDLAFPPENKHKN